MKAVFDSCGLKANCSSLRIEAGGTQTQVRFGEETGCSLGCLLNVTSGKLQHILGEISNSCDINSRCLSIYCMLSLSSPALKYSK